MVLSSKDLFFFLNPTKKATEKLLWGWGVTQDKSA
jgi:hypothetical protein